LLQEVMGVNVTVRFSEPSFGFQANNQQGIVLSREYSIAGVELGNAVTKYLKDKHHLLVGLRTAESVILQIGSALPLETGLVMIVRGRDLLNGLPTAVEITDSEIREAIADVITRIADTIKEDIGAI